MTQRNDIVSLRHMLEHAQTAVELSKGKDRAALITEPMLRYSLLPEFFKAVG